MTYTCSAPKDLNSIQGYLIVPVSATPDTTLQWRHKRRDGVWNHPPHHRLLNRLFRRLRWKNQNSASPAFVLGIHRSPVNSPHKGQWRGKCFHLMTSSWIGSNEQFRWFLVHRTNSWCASDLRHHDTRVTSISCPAAARERATHPFKGLHGRMPIFSFLHTSTSSNSVCLVNRFHCCCEIVKPNIST